MILGARSKDTIAAGGDPKDYLSWAPYWWPDCNWCGGNPNSTSNSTTVNHSKRRRSSRKRLDDSDSSSEAFFTVETAQATASTTSLSTSPAAESDVSYGTVAPTTSASSDEWGLVYQPARKQNSVKRLIKSSTSATVVSSTTTASPSSSSITIAASPSSVTASFSSQSTAFPSSTSDNCRPSPTTSMAPSATYSICPYVRKDGQVNPDVRSLPGSTSLTHATQATLLNALAFAITGTAEHASNAVRYIRTFFLDEETAINPSAAYAQVIRGHQGVKRVDTRACLISAVWSRF